MLYHNGVAVETENIPAIAPVEENEFSIGRGFEGNLDEVRIWKTARTQENILDNLFSRLQGERQDLTTYYTFDVDNSNSGFVVQDNSLQVNNLQPNRTATEQLNRLDYTFSTAPIGNDIALIRNAIEGVATNFQDTIDSRPAVEEYGDLQYTPTGDLVGAMKRSYSFIKDGEWKLYNRGGQFISYRKLQQWLNATACQIQKCATWQRQRQLWFAIEADYKKHKKQYQEQSYEFLSNIWIKHWHLLWS
ncbi:MAG: LamG domain-containing protein, partial [Symploca sp. SIO1C4]|nr:LamG domain-containing protein [Symploca sp. SIO1C4]